VRVTDVRAVVESKSTQKEGANRDRKKKQEEWSRIKEQKLVQVSRKTGSCTET
jgi:hypothetical protein